MVSAANTNAEPLRQISLVDLAKTLAGPKGQYEIFYGQIFSLIAPSLEQVSTVLESIREISKAGFEKRPLQILIGDFSALIKHQAHHVMSVKDGNLNVFWEVSDRKLPSCLYLAIVTPADKVENGTNYGKAYEAINFVRAFLTLHFGRLLFYEKIADFEFNRTGQLSFASEPFRMPLFADHLKILDTNLTRELIERLSVQQPPFKALLQRACNFISAALNQKDDALRFSSYWIALEILAQGSAGAIRARLASAYGNSSTAFIDKDLRFAEISQNRHELLHHGKFKPLFSYQERLIHLYFWDIITHRINLKPRHLALALIKSGVIEQELQSRNGQPPFSSEPEKPE